MLETDRLVLAWLVKDPDAWYAHALNTFGLGAADEMLRAKVDRWAASYQSAADKRPRAERGEDEE